MKKRRRKSRDSIADEICQRYGEIEHRGGKVLQRWHGIHAVTFAYLIYWWVLVTNYQTDGHAAYHIYGKMHHGDAEMTTW